MTLLLTGWPRIITETMTTATKIMQYSRLIVLFSSIQFGNDSNYSKFNGENIATNCSRVTVLASDGLTKGFGYYALLEIFPSDHQVRTMRLILEPAAFKKLVNL